MVTDDPEHIPGKLGMKRKNILDGKPVFQKAPTFTHSFPCSVQFSIVNAPSTSFYSQIKIHKNCTLKKKNNIKPNNTKQMQSRYITAVLQRTVQQMIYNDIWRITQWVDFSHYETVFSIIKPISRNFSRDYLRNDLPVGQHNSQPAKCLEIGLVTKREITQ